MRMRCCKRRGLSLRNWRGSSLTPQKRSTSSRGQDGVSAHDLFSLVAVTERRCSDVSSLLGIALAGVRTEMGNKLVNVATTEAHPPLGNALRKIGRAYHSLSDLDQAQAISECVIIGDSLGYQGLNARSAKETLQQRTGVLEEYQAAVKMTISKRRNAERLKASSNIRPEKVSEAIEEMEEVSLTCLWDLNH